MTCSCRFSEFGGLIIRNNEQLGSEIAIKTTRSSHCEVAALLSRKKDVERIDIEMTVDREGVTAKMTYQ